MRDQPTPVGVAIVICDLIIEDKLTSKKSLIGIFNQIGTQNFPYRHPQICVFVSVTEGRGQCAARDCELSTTRVNYVVAEVNGSIEFPDVNAAFELNLNLVGLVFPQPGTYSIEFYCDDALVLERRFNVIHIKPATGAPPAEM